MGAEPTHVVAGSRPWVRRVFEETIRDLPGRWEYASSPAELTAERLAALGPRYVFLPHWSWILPREIVEAYQCVGFHMSDLPRGRGGSPLQHLILRGQRTTVLTAFRLTPGVDDGPVYLKRELALEGTAEQIYVRATRLAATMIAEILADRPEPRPQQGEPERFARRTPEQSRIPRLADLEALADFVRMLDAEGYPHAFLEHAGFRFEFRRAAVYDGAVVADARITRLPAPTGEPA